MSNDVLILPSSIVDPSTKLSKAISVYARKSMVGIISETPHPLVCIAYVGENSLMVSMSASALAKLVFGSEND